MDKSTITLNLFEMLMVVNSFSQIMTVSYFICAFKILLQQGISEPIFYGDLAYKFEHCLFVCLVLNDASTLGGH